VLVGYEEKGYSADKLLISLGFRPLAGLGDKLMSVSEFNVLCIAIQNQLKDEMLGFSLIPMPLGGMTVINRMMTQLPTLDAAIDTMNDYFTLFNEGKPVFTVSKTQGKANLTLNLNSSLQQSSAYYMQRMLLGTYKQLCWLVKGKIGLNKVELAFPIDDVLSEFQYVFGCSNIVESDICRMEFSEDVFAKPVVQVSDGASVFSEYANFYTLLWPNLEALDLKIRLLIGSDISKGFPSISTLAAQLEVSPQTLSRRLNEHGTNYRTIKDDIRRDVSISLLRNSKLSVKEIAYKIGFQESSAFSKAFKQWFGMAPSTYREERLDNSNS